LENYRTPARIVGKPGRWGTVSERLAPVFRDRDELSASADIGERLREALAASEFLIVLCSPAAARSRWVNAEIEAYSTTHASNRDRTLAVVLAGEPNSPDAALNCFPPALQNDSLDGRLLSVRQPLAADFRPGQDRLVDAELRLIAALLGVEFDVLKQRETERRVRRLRGWLAATVAGGVAFVAISALAIREGRRADDAALRATRARNEAEKLVEFMLYDLRPKLEAVGRANLLEPANEKVLAYYQSVPAAEESVEILRRKSAAQYQRAIDLYNHGDKSKTLPMLRTSAALREKVVALVPGDLNAQLALADSRRVLANQLQDAGDSAGALREIGLAIAQAQAAATNHPQSYLAVERLASLHTEEAETLIRMGRTAEAESKLKSSLETLENLLGSHPDDAELKDRTAAAAWKLGVAWRRLSDFARAEKCLNRSVDLAAQLRDSDPANIQYIRRYQLSSSSLCAMLNDAGRNEEARALGEKCVASAREIVARDPTNQIYLATLATTLSQLTEALCNADREREALPFAREEVEIVEKRVKAGLADARTRWTYAMALSTYGTTLIAAGQFADAVAADRKAVAIQQAVSDSDVNDAKMRDDLGYLHSRLGFALSAAKIWADAEAEFRKSMAIMDEILVKDAGNPQLVRKGERAEWELGLGIVLRENGAVPAARQALTECIASIDQAVAAGLPATAEEETRRNAKVELAKLATQNIGPGKAPAHN
jgi:tetratricopeptide (TPR) repeat protein